MINQKNFDRLMRQFAPFERAPHIAVATSGGADSMALVLLVDEWTRHRDGRVTALIVDHDLRAESAHEAAMVSRQLSELGIESEVLRWHHDNNQSAVQERARAGRYEVMEQWCRDHAVLHLATAHHAVDQAETMLMRLQRGSGPDGLAGIPSTRELTWCRIIRPLLETPKDALINHLHCRGIPWVEDASNFNPKFERSRVRELIRSEAIDVDGYARSAARYDRLREAADITAAKWMAVNAQLSKFGFLELDCARLFDAPEDIRLRVLSRVATVIGGKAYPPAIASTERLAHSLRNGRSTTLSGAIFRLNKDRILVCREARNLPPTTQISHNAEKWDGRFQIANQSNIDEIHVLPFCDVPDTDKSSISRPAWFAELPYQARLTLPVFRIGDEFLVTEPGVGAKASISVKFAPKLPLTGMGFSVA